MRQKEQASPHPREKNLNPHLKWHTFLFLVTGAHKGAITRFGVDSTLFSANRHFWVSTSVPISHGFIFRPSNFDPSNFVKQYFRAQYQIIIFCKHWDRTQQLSLTILNRKIIFNFKNVSFIVIALLSFFQWNWRGGGWGYISFIVTNSCCVYSLYNVLRTIKIFINFGIKQWSIV